jgi:hypothetical protein
VGGTAAGRTVLVRARPDSKGRPVPDPSVYHWVEYHEVDSGPPLRETLNYVLRPLHDGSVVYALHGLPEKDFELEELISRLRASWTGVELLSDQESVPYPRGEMPDEAARYMERKLFHRLHELAREQDLMIIEFIGPTWQLGPFQTDTCVLQARCTQRPKA